MTRDGELTAPLLARLARLACAIALAGFFGMASANTIAAEDPTTLEQRVKAAFLYQFASYVEWPAPSFAQPDTPLTIGVLGAETLAVELKQLVAGRAVGGHPVAVKEVKPGESLAGLHILFIGGAENGRLGQISQPGKQRPMLTVTETEGSLSRGSMINFVIVDRRVRFEVGLDSAEKSGLRLSSRLLAVAQQVRTGTP